MGRPDRSLLALGASIEEQYETMDLGRHICGCCRCNLLGRGRFQIESLSTPGCLLRSWSNSTTNPEQFDEAAREYVAANKIPFSLEDAGKNVVVHISGTNAPISVEYWHGLHYLKVQFDRNGKPLGHRQGINYVR